MLKLGIQSTKKQVISSKNVGRALVKKQVLITGQKETDTINDADIYVTCKDIYLSENKRGEKLL